jgi:hypothetical protein
MNCEIACEKCGCLAECQITVDQSYQTIYLKDREGGNFLYVGYKVAYNAEGVEMERQQVRVSSDEPLDYVTVLERLALAKVL